MWTAEQQFLTEEHQGIFDETKHIPGWQMPGDSYKLYEMAYRHGDVILEIGIYGGRSAVVELRGALANSERTAKPQFFGVDIDFYSIWRANNALVEASVDEHALLFHGDLEQFIQTFPIRPTMVFVDGDHRYEGVKRDLALLAKFLSPGTPILCHDYTNPDNDTGVLGVRRAVQEFVADGYAELQGTFGCSAFLIMSGKCEGQGQLELSPQEFLHHKATLLSKYAKGLYDQFQINEADRAARLDVIQSLQSQIQQIQQNLHQVEQPGSLSAAEQPDQSETIATLKKQLLDIQSSFETTQSSQQKLQETQQKLQHLRHKLKQNRQQLSQTQTELQATQGKLQAVESSKFWKLRQAWFKVRRSLGLSSETT